MSRNCKVPYCIMKFGMRKHYPALSFHEFPSNWDQREKWLHAIRRNDFVPQDTDRVCSIHFLPSDFKTGCKVVRLKPGAVPSIFPSFPKYLQSKRKPGRRSIKKATPEIIESFKRKRKVKKRKRKIQDESGEQVHQDVEYEMCQDTCEPDSQLEYEVIPLDQNSVRLNISDANTPATRDASTQANGLWDRIQEQYKLIRNLHKVLQKKTNQVTNLTKQNKKLQDQVNTLKAQKKKEPSKEKSKQSRKKMVKENVQHKSEDLSGYLHPRVPRSLCPPKNTGDKNNTNMILSVNHLNQVMMSHNCKTPEKTNEDSKNVNEKNPILYSQLNSAGKEKSAQQKV